MHKLFAVFIGIVIAFMITCNGLLSNYVGDYVTLIVIHIVGLITSISILLLKKERISKLREIPVYLFSAGAIGVLLLFLNNLCFSFLGVSLTLALGLLGQSVAACTIDHYGLFGMEIKKFKKEKLVGFILIFMGIIIMVIY